MGAFPVCPAVQNQGYDTHVIAIESTVAPKKREARLGQRTSPRAQRTVNKTNNTLQRYILSLCKTGKRLPSPQALLPARANSAYPMGWCSFVFTPRARKAVHPAAYQHQPFRTAPVVSPGLRGSPHSTKRGAPQDAPPLVASYCQNLESLTALGPHRPPGGSAPPFGSSVPLTCPRRPPGRCRPC